MAQRSRVVSLLVIVVIVLVAAGMYVAFGNQGGFTGVPRLLPPDVAQGASANILYNIGWGLLIVVIFAAFAFILYKMRRLTD